MSDYFIIIYSIFQLRGDMIDGKNGVVEIPSFDLSVDEVFTGQKIASADPCEEKHMLKYVFFACLTYNLLCIYMVTLDD